MRLEAAVHLCLVAENITPNLTPLLNDETRPAQVVLMCSADQLRRAEYLAQAITVLGDIAVSIRCWTAADNAAAIRHDLAELLADLQETSVALNASGGTRLISLVTAEVFQRLDKPVFYIDAATDHVVSVCPSVEEYCSLTTRVSVQHYLTASGYPIQEKKHVSLTRSQRAFAQELLANIRHYSGALAILNWLALSSGGGFNSKPIEHWHMSYPTFIGLLDRLRDVGLALVNRNCLVFPGESEKYFVKGGWLQDYVALELAELRERFPAIQDIEQRLMVGAEGSALTEIDSVFLVNNRLHLIECRARKFKKGNAKNGAEAAHRLDDLVELGQRLRARVLLLSYVPLREVDLRRMQLMGIKVLQEKQLQNLRFYLQAWLEEAVVGE